MFIVQIITAQIKAACPNLSPNRLSIPTGKYKDTGMAAISIFLLGTPSTGSDAVVGSFFILSTLLCPRFFLSPILDENIPIVVFKGQQGNSRGEVTASVTTPNLADYLWDATIFHCDERRLVGSTTCFLTNTKRHFGGVDSRLLWLHNPTVDRLHKQIELLL